MSDSSPLAGLLDRAGNVFSLAGKLGREFHEEHQRQGRQIDPSIWDHHATDFNEFCSTILDLRDPMQNPPDGFATVAEVLREAARTARSIRDVMQRSDGQAWAAYRDFFPDLNSVCEAGVRALKQTRNAIVADDPFAFLDESPTSDRATGDEFIGRLLAGPNDATLTDREMALLVAYLKQPVSLSQIQREKSNEGQSTTLEHRRKLKLIRDFNRKLKQVSVASASEKLEPQYTFGRLLQDVTNSESSYRQNIEGANRVAREHRKVAAHWNYIQAGILKWRPDPSQMPGIGELEAVCNSEGSDLNRDWLRQARGRVAVHLGISVEEVDAMSLPEVTGLLRSNNSSDSERGTKAGQTSEITNGDRADHHELIGKGSAVDGSANRSAGFMGGAELANAMGVHPTRLSAFLRQLDRQRIQLGDDCWYEVREPRPNSPRYVYRVDAPKIRDLAARYQSSKLG